MSTIEDAIASGNRSWQTPPTLTPEKEPDFDSKEEGQYLNLMSERMRQVMRDPRYTEDEKKFLVKVTMEALGPAPSTDAEMAIAEKNAYLRLKADTNAQRRIAAESYAGTTELSWDDLEAAHSSYLVQDLIPDDAIVFLVGKSNLGKSFTHVDAACRMACGMDWLGKKTRQAKILIVLGEGRNGFIDRLKAWCEHNGKSLDDLKPWLFFVDGANLNSDESLERVKAIADREEVELIIFDTWANVSGVQKEEDNALNTITMNRALTIRPGATYWFIHHPRKAEESTDSPVMRGAGALQGRAEVVMTLYKEKGYIPSSGEKYDFLALSTEADHGGKNRTAGTETIHGIYLEETTHSRVLSQVVSESISSKSRAVRQHLNKTMTVKEFAQAYGMPEGTARRYLDAAVEDGIAVKNEGSGPKPTTYSPTQNWSVAISAAAVAGAA